MSLVSIRLRGRVVEPEAPPVCSCPTVCPHPVRATLADVVPGQQVRIVAVCDEAAPAIARRLFDLGFAPGVEVEMLRRAPLADPVIYRIAGYEIALRRAQARCIFQFI